MGKIDLQNSNEIIKTLASYVKVDNGKLVGVLKTGESLEFLGNGKVTKILSEVVASKSNKKIMVVKDNNNRLYLTTNRLLYNSLSDKYQISCHGYDLVTEEEVIKIYGMLDQSGVASDSINEIEFFDSKDKKITRFGNLYLVWNSYISAHIRANKTDKPLVVSSDEFKGVKYDAYLSMFRTSEYAYDRGLGRRGIKSIEEILARRLKNCEKASLVGEMVPLKGLKPKAQEILEEEKNKLSINQNYNVLKHIYKKLGFEILPVEKVSGISCEEIIYRYAVKKDILPAVVLGDKKTPEEEDFYTI